MAEHTTSSISMSKRLMRPARMAAVLLLSLGSLAVTAAEDVRIISFDEAVRIALERNSTLRQVQNAAEVDAVAVQEARMRFVPDLRFSTQGQESFGRSFSSDEGRVINQTTESASLGLSSSVVLFDGLSNVARLRGARLSAQAGTLDVHRSRETIVFTVASNFLALIQQQEQLRVRRESLVAEQALEEQIQTFVNAGARTIADLYQQQASLATAQLAVVDAERAARLANVDLMQTLQLDPAGRYEFEAPPVGSLYSSTAPTDLQTLLTLAKGQRADLVAGQARVDAADQAMRAARAGRWPTISLSAGYNSAYTSASEEAFADQLQDRRGGSVGLNLSVPIFDRSATQIAARRALLQAQSARIDLESLENQVGLQVLTAHLDLEAAHAQLTAAEAQLRAAELALQASQDRYRAGASTLVELTQARATQVSAASAVVSARYNEMFQRTLMDYYIGALDANRSTNNQ